MLLENLRTSDAEFIILKLCIRILFKVFPIDAEWGVQVSFSHSSAGHTSNTDAPLEFCSMLFEIGTKIKRIIVSWGVTSGTHLFESHTVQH